MATAQEKSAQVAAKIKSEQLKRKMREDQLARQKREAALKKPAPVVEKKVDRNCLAFQAIP